MVNSSIPPPMSSDAAKRDRSERKTSRRLISSAVTSKHPTRPGRLSSRGHRLNASASHTAPRRDRSRARTGFVPTPPRAPASRNNSKFTPTLSSKNHSRETLMPPRRP